MTAANDDDDKLPTIWEALSQWLGVQLPTVQIPLLQTRKNVDKALSRIVLALGRNAEARVDRNTAGVEGATEKSRAIGATEVDRMLRTEEDRRKLENRACTVMVALEDLETNPPDADATCEIDEDWLNLFARLAEDKSSAKLQQLFGKILSGEVRRPGSYSLRTLQILALISTPDAERVSRLMSYSLDMAMVPFEEGADGCPTTADRLFLEELGLAGHPNKFGGMVRTTSIPAGQTKLLMASKFAIVIINNSQNEIAFRVPCQLLTTPGRELAVIASPPPTDVDFLKKVARQMYEWLRGHSEEMRRGEIVLEVATITHLDQDQYRFEGFYAPSEEDERNRPAA
jgi:hypothetical protein